MNCVLSAHSILKKVIETALESTECIRICFHTSGPYPVTLMSLDALWVCQSTTRFTQKCFDRHVIPRDVSISVDVKRFNNFIRLCKGSRKIQMDITEDGKLRLREVGTDHDREKLLPPIEDNYAYESVNNPHPWTKFEMHPVEFSNILLDFTVGGGEASFCVDSNWLLCKTHFDSGCMKHAVPVCYEGPRVHSGKYIVKFLKLVCSMVVLCSRLNIHIEASPPKRLLVELMDDSEHIHHTFLIHEYSGPHRRTVDPGAVAYAMRIN